MPESSSPREGRRSPVVSTLALTLYGLTRSRSLRDAIRRLTLRFEGGPMYSLTVREMFRRHHALDVGLYTIGPCEAGPGHFAPGTSIGRYCSVYYTVRTLGPQSPIPLALRGALTPASPSPNGSPSTHRLVIGNDVFIGHNTIILPTVESIGDGVIIGAGSVVQQDIPPYGVVTGNPARVVRQRFTAPTIARLLEEQWWTKSIEELGPEMDSFRGPLEAERAKA
ncbi:MAG: CatB-related O-acetyltransferase [Limisphaerales bacterium]